MTADPLIYSTSPLKMADAVAALILVENDGYLMQHRDLKPQIWHPGCWGLFGGAIESGEDEVAALTRELDEELELKLASPRFFARFTFDLGGIDLGAHIRSFYTVEITRAACAGLSLHEGAGMKVFAAADILVEPRITPYDSFAIFLHHARNRLRQGHEKS